MYNPIGVNGKWRAGRRPCKITIETKPQPTPHLPNCLDWVLSLKERRQAWRNLAREGGKGDAPSLSLHFLPKKLKAAWPRTSVPANSTYKAGSNSEPFPAPCCAWITIKPKGRNLLPDNWGLTIHGTMAVRDKIKKTGGRSWMPH